MVNLAEYYKYQISKEGLEVSQEYNTFNWRALNPLYRFFNNIKIMKGDIKVKIIGLKFWVNYFTGKLTSFGELFSLLESQGSLADNMSYDRIQDKLDYKALYKLKEQPSIYYELFMKTPKYENIEHYKNMFINNKEAITAAKKTCELSNWVGIHQYELDELYRFKPEKAFKEMSDSIEKIKNDTTIPNHNEWLKLYNDVAKEMNDVLNWIISRLKLKDDKLIK